MKIVYGSTTEQEKTIDQLLVNLRYSILPLYVSEEKLSEYDSMGLLQFNSQRNLYNGTLKEAFQVMTALHTVISIIENKKEFKYEEYLKYEKKFNCNMDLLNYYGLFFPFNFHYFTSAKSQILHNNYNTQITGEFLM